MREDFIEVSGCPETIEELAEDYDLADLPALYAEQARNVTVMDFKGLSLKAFSLVNRDCRIEFSYCDDIAVPGREKLLTGFRLDFIDYGTDEILLSAIHAETPEMPGLFSITISDMARRFEGLEILHTTNPAYIVCFLTNQKPNAVAPSIVGPRVN